MTARHVVGWRPYHSPLWRPVAELYTSLGDAVGMCSRLERMGYAAVVWS